ncbi:Acetylornithine deacetylase/succinyldiaminopimelate desuccinylase-like deacylase [Frankia canadensis]|uniref:Acetylornithine deacetylase/succinyldiaminopimelate desuccinylase-like deacylase n=1 Tax=Frankia canadensis TaxID=1836972 RepID=A0A2I2KXP1_9ACTN|nr:M20/M25/M40 family metallo-hydrolase [Frankia canadensis]SNQ50426.1 Acetylornithine deacetylase/succinyldiaminopimelate desuccinylase-like deacylase [Frankia canadensis]SOU57716.1 Acetylornithine deacetylase/succinyldiaminopimelate desuccinylase-like deacylase [Frankia canadensis]
MPDALEDLNAYVDASRPEFERRLAELVAIPGVSADPAHAADIARTAEHAAALLRDAGLAARVVPTAGSPVVVGEYLAGPDRPTVTIYNHLDVQPADPAQWRTEPFRLTVDGERYAGRGSTDDKGPALTALQAAQYAVARALPVNIRFVWELEEEIGSPNFEAFVRAEGSRLRTDVVLVSDSIWIAADRPAIDYGLRGLVTFEVTIETGTNDTHSGLTGGAARNPLTELAGIISECVDPVSGRILVPGFADTVAPVTDEELDDFVASGFDVATFMAAHGLTSLRSADTREVLRRVMAEPTFEVHGLTGGYTGPGVKTVVPPRATAKLSARLVPHQDPQAVFALVRDFITARHPDARVELEAALAPYLGPRTGPYAEAASAAVEYAFGRRPAFVREGGSIGAVLTMDQHLRAPVILLGLSLPSHGYHAPNEHYDWTQAAGGIRMFVHYFHHLAARPARA